MASTGSVLTPSAQGVVRATKALHNLVVASRNDGPSPETCLENLLAHLSDLLARYRTFRDYYRAHDRELYPFHDAFLRSLADLQSLIRKYQKAVSKRYGDASVTLREALQIFPPTQAEEAAAQQVLDQLYMETVRFGHWRDMASGYEAMDTESHTPNLKSIAPEMRIPATTRQGHSSTDSLSRYAISDEYVDSAKYSPEVMRLSPYYPGLDFSTPRPSTMGQSTPTDSTPTWNSSPFSSVSMASTTATSIAPEPLELPQPWLAIPSPKERIIGSTNPSERMFRSDQALNVDSAFYESLKYSPYNLLHGASSIVSESIPTPRQRPVLIPMNTRVPAFSSLDSPSDPSNIATSPTSPIHNPRISETTGSTSGGTVAKQSFRLSGGGADVKYILYLSGQQRRPSHPTHRDLAKHVKSIAVWRDLDTRILLAIRSYEDGVCTVYQKPSSTSLPIPHIDIQSLGDYSVYFLNNPHFRLEGSRAASKMDDFSAAGEYKLMYHFRCEEDWTIFQELVLNRTIDGYFVAEKIKCTTGARTTSKLSYNQVIRILSNGRGEKFIHFLAHVEMNAFFEIPMYAFSRIAVKERAVCIELSTESSSMAQSPGLSTTSRGAADTEMDRPALPMLSSSGGSYFRPRRSSSVSMQSHRQNASEPWRQQMWRDITITFKSHSDAVSFAHANGLKGKRIEGSR
ncbi:hypothetical protein H072_11400 [Dactylellina haptotyla CBS 200.50]|uniref:Uncharacterized protein n=1 Tax=Dactylellina haptotyla (strain CBS 200.50) TaxID=1284197 RepID=S8B894_DACHA|nr:hypothetical protein H072_11400 [Dactylellina haptotyla CBS 200.50]